MSEAYENRCRGRDRAGADSDVEHAGLRRVREELEAAGALVALSREKGGFRLDEAVLGAPFYVMERVVGVHVVDELPAGYADTEAERRALAR